MADVVLTDRTGPPLGVPHLAFPFEVLRQGNRVGARTVEQDSRDEIAQCVYAALATEPGSRVESPAYGLGDPTFLGADFDEIRTVIEEWEPRARYLADDELQEAIETVSLTLG